MAQALVHNLTVSVGNANIAKLSTTGQRDQRSTFSLPAPLNMLCAFLTPVTLKQTVYYVDVAYVVERLVARFDAAFGYSDHLLSPAALAGHLLNWSTQVSKHNLRPWEPAFKAPSLLLTGYYQEQDAATNSVKIFGVFPEMPANYGAESFVAAIRLRPYRKYLDADGIPVYIPVVTNTDMRVLAVQSTVLASSAPFSEEEFLARAIQPLLSNGRTVGLL